MSDAYDLNGQRWRDRIVGFDRVPPDSLLANERNWRIHPKAQQDALAGVLSDVGWVDTVMVNLRQHDDWDDNSRGVPTVVDGHARIKLALRNEEPEIPALFVDLSPSEEAEVLATFDPIAAMAATDAEMLEDVLRDVQTGDEALQQMLSEMAEKSGLVLPDGETWEDAFGALPEGDRAPFQQMTFTLHDTQAEQVKEALGAAKALGPFDTPNENSNGNALARVCETFLTDYGQS